MSLWLWGLGLGAGAFFVRLLIPHAPATKANIPQGRAALVAIRKNGVGGSKLGRSFYKGGFEPKMTRREAALILEIPYVGTSCLEMNSHADF
jgi:DnaJ family protein C protein 19